MQILGGTPQHANFGWNPNTRDKKYMILIMSKKLTKRKKNKTKINTNEKRNKNKTNINKQTNYTVTII